MRFKMIWMDADKGGGGSAGGDTGNAAPYGGAKDATSSGGEDAKSYTQADLDRLFAERARQASGSEQKRILSELGLQSLDEVKSLVKKQREADQAQLSELDKMRKQLADLEAEKKTMADERRALVLRTEIERAAQKLGVVDTEAAYKLLDLSTLELDAAGAPQDVEKALKALLIKKPYLVAGTGQTSATNPDGNLSKIMTSDPLIIAARKAAGLPG